MVNGGLFVDKAYVRGLQWIAYNFWREIAVADRALKRNYGSNGNARINDAEASSEKPKEKRKNGQKELGPMMLYIVCWMTGGSILLITDHNW